MPRHYVRKTGAASYTTELLNTARQEVRVNKRSISEVSLNLGISRTTLTRYLKSNDDRLERKKLGTKTIFTPTEEQLLCQYILDCSKMFHGLTITKARELAYNYAVNLGRNVPNAWADTKIASKDWMAGFRGRNKTLSLRSPEATSLGRATAFNKATVGEFFENLGAVYSKEMLTPDRIFNIDETGITTVQKPQRVLATKGVKQLGQVVSAERGTTVTMVCCVSAVGQSIPPVYIFPRVNFKDHMLSGAPPGSKGFATVSGWMTNILFPEVLKHFISHMNSSKERKTLLLLDNHASHISCETIDVAKKHGVILLTFPPHCSHRLQPLDISVYGPFKTYYNSCLDNWMLSHPGQTVTIYHLAETSGSAYMKALTPSNITKGFMKSGISPYNKDIFDDQDFMSSAVTDRPLASPSEPQDADGSPLPPLPKAPPRKATTNRTRVKTAILTTTPTKCNTDDPTSSQIAIESKTKSMAVKRTRPIELSDSEDDDAITPVSTDSEEPDDNVAQEEPDLEVGRFVVVQFKVKNACVHYVGQIVEMVQNEMDVKVDFYRCNKNRFTKPEEPDCQFVEKDQIVMMLPPPMSAGRTERSLGGLGFAVKMAGFNMR